jgi:hypothetical protein
VMGQNQRVYVVDNVDNFNNLVGVRTAFVANCRE